MRNKLKPKCPMTNLHVSFKAHSLQAKTKAKFFFDICRLFFDFFSLSLSFSLAANRRFRNFKHETCDFESRCNVS